jgi:outer membrane receptor protein involved in Fe transport
VSAFGSVSGNKDLENETADSWSLGLVYQPALASNFRVAIDWSDISLKGGIQSLGINDLLATCYDSADFPNTAACAKFRRLTAADAAAQPGATRIAGDIANGFTTGYINVAGIEFAGLIVDAAYTFDLRDDAAGALRLSTKLFYTDKFEIQRLTGAPTDNRVGTVGVPKYRVNTTLGYSLRDFDADLQAIWRQSTVGDPLATYETTPLNEYPAYTLVNASFGYRFGDSLRAQLAVANLMDKQIPPAARQSLQFGVFDPLGRRYFLTLVANF